MIYIYSYWFSFHNLKRCRILYSCYISHLSCLVFALIAKSSFFLYFSQSLPFEYCKFSPMALSQSTSAWRTLSNSMFNYRRTACVCVCCFICVLWENLNECKRRRIFKLSSLCQPSSILCFFFAPLLQVPIY